MKFNSVKGIRFDNLLKFELDNKFNLIFCLCEASSPSIGVVKDFKHSRKIEELVQQAKIVLRDLRSFIREHISRYVMLTYVG